MKQKLLSYFEIKSLIKNKISSLPDYSAGEEDFLLQEVFALNKDKLLVKRFTNKDVNKTIKVVNIRKTGKPLNKIFKHCYFYKNDFYINNNVLAPRQETEILVENAINTINSLPTNTVNVLDLCCGSGIIGLSVAKHSKKSCKVVLSDVSSKALKITKINAKKLGLKHNIKVIQSNLFNNLKEENKFDIILSNPPYIKTDDISSLSIGVQKYDPLIALDGGKNGLFFYKEICKTCKRFLTPNGVVMVEIGYNQKKDVEELFKCENFSTTCLKDYSNNNRVIIAKLKKENNNDR